MERLATPTKSRKRSTSASWLVRGATATALAMILAGCAVGPDYKIPHLQMPSKWSNDGRDTPSRAPDLAHWWTKLNDPVLDKIVDQAVDGNLDVASAKARVREARANYKKEVGSLFPSADGSASYTRQRSSSVVSNQFSLGTDASWQIDLFGANRRAVEAAKYGLDASNEDLRNTLLTMISDITTYYVQARGYQARIDLAERTAASQRETAQLTKQMFEAGTSSAVDMANAEGEAATTQATVGTLKTSYAEAVHSLSILTGQAPTALYSVMNKQKSIPRPKLPIPAGIPADVLNDRPDVRLAEREYAEYTAKVGEATAARYPSVSLTGDIATNATNTGDLSKNSSISWAFGPSLSIPLFNAGQLKAAEDVARAERDQYFIAYKSSVLGAMQDVENSLVALSQERVRYHHLTTSADAYRQAATLSRTLYQSGSSSFLDYLTAERSLFSAEDSLLESQVLITTNYIALNIALGGGWDGAIDTSKPEVKDGYTGPHFAKLSK